MLNVILTTMAGKILHLFSLLVSEWTGLAGRIWWASRSAGRFLGQDVSKRYHLTVAIM